MTLMNQLDSDSDIADGSGTELINDFAVDTITDLDGTQLPLPYIANPVTINATGALNIGVAPNTWSNSYSFTTINSTGADNSLSVSGDANFDGDIIWQGRSLGQLLEKIQQRLSILTPDPKKLAASQALQRAYEHYLTLERLVQINEDS